MKALNLDFLGYLLTLKVGTGAGLVCSRGAGKPKAYRVYFGIENDETRNLMTVPGIYLI